MEIALHRTKLKNNQGEERLFSTHWSSCCLRDVWGSSLWCISCDAESDKTVCAFLWFAETQKHTCALNIISLNVYMYLCNFSLSIRLKLEWTRNFRDKMQTSHCSFQNYPISKNKFTLKNRAFSFEYVMIDVSGFCDNCTLKTWASIMWSLCMSPAKRRFVLYTSCSLPCKNNPGNFCIYMQ